MKRNEILELYEFIDGKAHWKVSNSNNAKIGARAGSKQGNGYRLLKVNGERYLEHRVVWFLHHGTLPKYIDHINGDREDNRIENLREADNGQNMSNRGKQTNNTSGFKGVWKHSTNKAWIAGVSKKYVGSFEDKQDAATAYNFAAAELHGEFAVFNTVPQPWLEGV